MISHMKGCEQGGRMKKKGEGGLPSFFTFPSIFLTYSVGDGAAVDPEPDPLDVDAAAMAVRSLH